jgi:hypothetical protein
MKRRIILVVVCLGVTATILVPLKKIKLIRASAAPTDPVHLSQISSIRIPSRVDKFRLVDFTVYSGGVAFLLGYSSVDFEYAVTTPDGSVLSRTQLPSFPASSGSISVSPSGKIAILRRGVGSEILVYDKTGSQAAKFPPAQGVMEITFVGEGLVAASTSELFNAEGSMAHFVPELDFPFSLLAFPNGGISVIEWTEARRRPLPTSAPIPISYPETLERPEALAKDGAAKLFDATVDEKGNIYCGLPNYVASHDVRILVLDPRGQKSRVLSYPMAFLDGSNHAHPHRIRVFDNRLYVSAVRYNYINSYHLE